MRRAVLAVSALLAAGIVSGCAELGVVTDGTSISYGRPNRGRLIDGVKLPDQGAGFTTGKIWRERGNRFGTNELVDLLKATSRRMKKKSKGARLVIADLSGNGGGAAHTFHRSHQTGRDVDILYYVRDAEGKVLEADVMTAFDTKLVAKDGSGITVDIPRNWLLVKDLLTAQEAYVQYIFMYRPIAEALIEHATQIGEPPELIARAARAVKQPGDSAPHNDHMHVRIYCPATDRQFGCVDIGPLELLAEREAEAKRAVETIAAALPPSSQTQVGAVAAVAPTGADAADADADDADADKAAPLAKTAADVWNETAAARAASGTATAAGALGATSSSSSFSTLMRATTQRIDLRGWR